MPRSGVIEDRTQGFTTLGKSSCWASSLSELPSPAQDFLIPSVGVAEKALCYNTLAAAASWGATLAEWLGMGTCSHLLISCAYFRTRARGRGGE